MTTRLIRLALIALLPTMGHAQSPSGTVRIVVPAHDIARQALITDADLSYADVPGANLYPGVITQPSDLAGMVARRILRAGEALRRDDVRVPVVVTKGETVTMTFSAPGITLTAVGRAMSEGGEGETVTVQNPASFRQISAVVTGPGQVRAGRSEGNATKLADARH